MLSGACSSSSPSSGGDGGKGAVSNPERDEWKKKRRREQNRVAAQHSRQRQRDTANHYLKVYNVEVYNATNLFSSESYPVIGLTQFFQGEPDDYLWYTGVMLHLLTMAAAT